MQREHPLRMILDNAMIDDQPPTDAQLHDSGLSGDQATRDQIRDACRQIHELHSGGHQGDAERLAEELADRLEPSISVEPADAWAVPDDDFDRLTDTVRHRAHGRATDNTLTLPERRR